MNMHQKTLLMHVGAANFDASFSIPPLFFKKSMQLYKWVPSMNYDMHFDINTVRLVRIAIEHEIARLDAARQSVGQESDNAIDLGNDAECLQIALDRLAAMLSAG
jgi:hypothetical protein